jgi:hypothetical protein
MSHNHLQQFTTIHNKKQQFTTKESSFPVFREGVPEGRKGYTQQFATKNNNSV